MLALNSNQLTSSIPNSISELKSLGKLDAKQNQLYGSIMAGIGELPRLEHLRLSSNLLQGSIPSGVCSLKVLTILDLSRNKINGTWIAITAACVTGMSLPPLRTLELAHNRFSGRIADGISFKKGLENLHIEFNRFTGSIPDGIGLLRRLRALAVSGNQLRGTIPVVVFGGATLNPKPCMQQLWLYKNRLAGCIPDAIHFMRGLSFLMIRNNEFRGALPSGLNSMLELSHLVFSSNEIRGELLPSGCELDSMVELLGEYNEIQGSLPDALIFMTELRKLRLLANQIVGALPDAFYSLNDLDACSLAWNTLAGSVPDAVGVANVQNLQTLELSWNALNGSIPRAVMSLKALTELLLCENRLSGTMPRGLTMLPRLHLLVLNGNDVSGTFPQSFSSLRSITAFDCGKTLLEGTLSAHVAALTDLSLFIMSGKEQRPSVRGILPPTFSRLKRLSTVLVQEQKLESAIPPFTSTIRVMALHRNSLESVPGLKLNGSTTLLLHCNRLSCQLPAGNSTSASVRMALVAVGNHLMWPDMSQFPVWISPSERDGLFWYSRGAGLWLTLKSVAGFSILYWAFVWHVGWRQYLTITDQWHGAGGLHGFIAVMMLSCFGFMASQVLGSCILLALALKANYYVCPGVFSLVNGCLSKRSSVQITVVVLMRRFWEECHRPWWISVNAVEKSEGSMARQSFAWMCWIILMLLLSTLTALNVASKSLPLFLPMGRHGIKLLDAGIGLVQGLLSSFALPYIASRVTYSARVRRASLISVACILCTCLIPAFVVLYLDISCADRWAQWWRVCHARHSQMFVVDLDLDNSRYLPVKVLRPGDICAPHMFPSVASCARSIALKLQDIIIAKLVTAVFLVPAVRLLSQRSYRRTDNVLVKLALLLELGMFLGAALPLIVPFLCVGISSERLLAAVAWRHRGKNFLEVSEAGDVRAPKEGSFEKRVVFKYFISSWLWFPQNSISAVFRKRGVRNTITQSRDFHGFQCENEPLYHPLFQLFQHSKGDVRPAIVITSVSSIIYHCCFVSEDRMASLVLGLTLLPMPARAFGCWKSTSISLQYLWEDHEDELKG